jgi:hypothetical protein
MAQPVASHTWVCERDNLDTASPYCARLLIDDKTVVSARGTDELTAFVRLTETIHAQGIKEGGVLALVALMRGWGQHKRSSTER